MTPPPRLLAPDLFDNCLQTLRDAVREAGNVVGRAPAPDQYLSLFFEWHANVERSLAHQLPPSEIQRLLYSPQYWALRNLASAAPMHRAWIDLELSARRQALTGAVNALEAASRRWRSDSATLVVPDTNFLLHHENTLSSIPWRTLMVATGDIRVVLLLAVIDELDRNKRNGQVKSRARTTLKELAAMEVAGTAGRHRLETDVGGLTTVEVLGQPVDHARLPDADSEIVDRAVALGELAGRTVTILTSDTGMQVRAGDADTDVCLVKTPDRP